jgi:hypothetical protein
LYIYVPQNVPRNEITLKLKEKGVKILYEDKHPYEEGPD